ncbi:MAG: hypothetical protein RIB86_23910, partial [Imperialibacter sp.]
QNPTRHSQVRANEAGRPMRPFLLYTLLLFSCSEQILSPEGYYKSDVRTFPFQVLISQSCTDLSNSRTIKHLDFVPGTGRLKLDGGHLILVHFSGKFIEFKGDTIVDLASLSDRLSRLLKPGNKFYRPEIDFLLSTKSQVGVFDGASGIVLVADQVTAIPETDEKEYCLSWIIRASDRIPEKYSIKLINIFGERLDSIVTDKMSIKLDLSKYGDGPQLFIVNVSDTDSPDYRSSDIAIRVGMDYFNINNSCNPTTAIEALEVAFHIERKYYATKESYPYFQLAAELSGDSIYSDLRARYESRAFNK